LLAEAASKLMFEAAPLDFRRKAGQLIFGLGRFPEAGFTGNKVPLSAGF
jgi:hypothetical protein